MESRKDLAVGDGLGVGAGRRSETEKTETEIEGCLNCDKEAWSAEGSKGELKAPAVEFSGSPAKYFAGGIHW